MERSESPDDEPFNFRPPLPPEDRVWRHPSELPRLSPGGEGAAALVAPRPPHQRGRTALAVALSATGALLVAGLVTVLFRTASRADDRAAVEPSVATTFGLTSGTPVGGRATEGEVWLRAMIHGQETEGAGVVLDGRGTIVTTALAVEGATSIIAVLADGTDATAVLLGIDSTSGAAVLTIPANPAAARTGRALTLTPGSTVYVDGPDRRSGSVVALGAHATTSSGHTLSHLLRVQMASSSEVPEGAALLDGDEDVVGIVTHTGDDDNNLYAIPIEIPRAAAQSIAIHGRVVVPWLGVTGGDMADQAGASIEQVASGSPAARAGLQHGDVIVALQGEPVASMADLALSLRDYDAGAVVDITYQRDGALADVSLMLAEAPSQ